MATNGTPTRYIELMDDIMNHVFQWATDRDWHKLPPKVNIALTTLMNELKIAKAIKESGVTDSDDDSITTERRRFISFFKKKYLESAGFDFNEAITPANKVNIARVINDLKEDGGNYIDFIEWFFDDFCSLEENKQRYMPVQLNLMCQKFIVNKFRYKMKDTFRMRKENIGEEAVRTMLLEIALPMQKRIASSDFSQKIIAFDKRTLTPTKFVTLMKAFAEKYNDTEGLRACEEIEEKIAAKKKPAGA